jgi:hypothetical protein
VATINGVAQKPAPAWGSRREIPRDESAYRLKSLEGIFVFDKFCELVGLEAKTNPLPEAELGLALILGVLRHLQPVIAGAVLLNAVSSQINYLESDFLWHKNLRDNARQTS